MSWKVGAACALAVLVFGLADPFAKVSAPANAVSAAPPRAVWRAGFAKPAAIPFPEDNPYTPQKAELGRRLFFDPILSGDGSRACVSCHLPDRGWSDGRPRARSRQDSDLDLHTPTVLNLAWQEGRLGWDGKFRDLESVAFMPITAPGNMNLPVPEALRRIGADASYVQAFGRAFEDGTVTQGRVEAALATFQRLIVSGPSPFDRWIAGDEAAIPEPAKRGFDLFNGRANCAACHGGWSFSDGSFHDIGTGRDEDVGRGRFVPNSTALRYAFKTPGLRDVARRAPFMHDGSLASLEDVVDLYDRVDIARPSRSRDIR
ncbi:cytochrome-c peroxidase, partial [Methylobacterium trifolii]